MGKVVTGGGLSPSWEVLGNKGRSSPAGEGQGNLLRDSGRSFMGKGDYNCRRVIKVAGVVEEFDKLDREQVS